MEDQAVDTIENAMFVKNILDKTNIRKVIHSFTLLSFANISNKTSCFENTLSIVCHFEIVSIRRGSTPHIILQTRVLISPFDSFE